MFKTKPQEENVNIPLIIIAGFIVFYTLYIWASLIIPFIISLLLSFALISGSHFFQKLKIPSFFSMVLSFWIYVLIFWILWELINANIQDIITKLPDYQSKVTIIIQWVFETLHLPMPENIASLLSKIDVAEIFTSILWGLASVFSNAWLIFFYTLFILLEYKYIGEKINLIISDKVKKDSFHEIIKKIKKDTKAYFIIKSIVSFVTAFLSYIVMFIFGLDFAVFWAVLIFILNFIPNVGSIIALIFPISISLIQYENFFPFIIITASLIWIQVLMWNIIEPKFMWNKLNLSPLTIIISLSFWWTLWGIIWMLLCVPIMVIINIILAKIPHTRPIAILLSEKWDLHVTSNQEIVESRRKLLEELKEKIRL